MSSTDLFTRYMEYINLERQQAPAVYHRWTLASIIGTLLGRQYYLRFGRSFIYPNQYIILMGTPGARKGTAMNSGRDLLIKADYNRFSSARTSLERFLIDMKQTDIDPTAGIADIEALVLDGASESYIFAGELLDFLSASNVDFITLLGDLWDNRPDYSHPKIQGKSVYVYQPTVNLLGGATPQTFSMTFPPEVIGTGFSSRVLLIHSEPTGRQVSWPDEGDELVMEQLACHLKEMRQKVKGEATFNRESMDLVTEIDNNEIPVDDNRFNSYQTRRSTHLKKLAMIHAAGELSTEVRREHVLRANTMLAVAEKYMPKAMGEFGKSKYALAANDILQFLGRRTMPASAPEIWKAVGRNLSKLTELHDVLANLKNGEKIKMTEVKGKHGYMTNHTNVQNWKPELIDTGWLTAEERF